MLALKLLSVVITYCLLVVDYSLPLEPELPPNKILTKRIQVIEHSVPVCIYIARYRDKYLKRQIVYSSGHPGLYNPSIITNQEAHMIYGNMEGTGSSKEPKERQTTARKKAKTISDYFSAAPGGNERTIYYDPAQACVSQSVAQITRTPTRTSDVYQGYQAAASPQVSPERHRVPTVVSSTLSKVHEPQAVIHVDHCKKTNISSYMNPHQPKSFEFSKRKFSGQNRSFQSLCRQGQAIQGDTDTESNFYQLMKLRGRDDPALLELLKKRGGDKYTSHDIQNEITEIMAHKVQRDLKGYWNRILFHK
ncbi:Hypothetical predicted protein [Paramuricea clavata]|uniref:Uncharacterized protein n=1 Tax=Paramuricea clavata TaxID=317549 RepID=A0A7D9IZ80_PARCT|nr:Hypothetical predicted protein [Paramuricea clavata]